MKSEDRTQGNAKILNMLKPKVISYHTIYSSLSELDCSTELVSRFSESVNLEYNGPVLNDYLLRFKDLGGIS